MLAHAANAAERGAEHRLSATRRRAGRVAISRTDWNSGGFPANHLMRTRASHARGGPAERRCKVPWTPQRSDDDTPSLWADLVSGRLTIFGRMALSVGGLGAAIVAALVALGLISEAGARVGEGTAALVLVVAGLAWLLLLSWLWLGHAVLGPLLRGAFALGAIWFVAILLAVIAESRMRHEEVWIAACMFGGLTATTLLIASLLYRRMRGRSIVGRSGCVNVSCPQCGYSLVGKTDCTCPECGMQYTLDQLIALQDYDALRREPASTPPHASRPAVSLDEPAALPHSQ